MAFRLGFWKFVCAMGLVVMSLPLSQPARAAQKVVWPFDQRQVALVRIEDQDFPDDRTLAQIMDGFVRRGRVRWVARKGGPGQVVALEVPRDFPWQSSVSVRQLGLKYKADGLLVLIQKGVQLNLQWYATVDGQPLFFESVSLPQAGPREGEDDARSKRLRDWIDDIWNKIPGQGYVVNRDFSTVTIEGAKQVGLKVGDVLELRRLQEMERHPLLKTLVQIRSSVTGRAVVRDVGDPFAVAKIEYESNIDPIQEGDRYLLLPQAKPKDKDTKPGAATATVPAAPVQKDGRSYLPLFGGSPQSATPQEGEAKTNANEEPEPIYKILDLTGAVILGSIKHEENVAGNSYQVRAFTPGFRLAAKFYVTRPVILNTDLTFLLPRFSNPPADYGTNSLGGGYTSFRIGGGYRFIFSDESPFPGEIDLLLGYRRLALSFSQGSADAYPTSKVYSGYELGVMLQLPIPPSYAVFVKGSRLLGTRLAESPVTSGDMASNMIWQFEAGGHYKLNKAASVTAGLIIESATTSFEGSGTRVTPSLSTVLNGTLFQGSYTYQF